MSSNVSQRSINSADPSERSQSPSDAENSELPVDDVILSETSLTPINIGSSEIEMGITEFEVPADDPADDDDEHANDNERDYDERLAGLSSELLQLLNRCVASVRP